MQASELRRRAIAAVAKLSIFAGAAGCTGNVVIAPDTDTDADIGADIDYDDDTDDGDTATEAPVDPGPEPAEPIEMPDLPLGPIAGTCSGATMNAACCNDVLEDAFTDPANFEDPMKTTTAQDKACCVLILDTLNTWDGVAELPFDPNLQWSCCTILPNAWQDFQPSCTPWGPPMPPAMPRRKGAARRAPAVAAVRPESRPFAAEVLA